MKETSNELQQNAVIRFGIYEFSPGEQMLSSPREIRHLTRTENKLLALLCSFGGRITPRRLALSSLWKHETYSNARSMDVYISRLRKYLRYDPSVFIVSVYGKGHKLMAPGFGGDAVSNTD